MINPKPSKRERERGKGGGRCLGKQSQRAGNRESIGIKECQSFHFLFGCGKIMEEST